MSKVAEKAGISQSTVSRVVNDQPGISEETVRKVRAAMREVGYRPAPRERRRGRKATVNVAVSDSAAVLSAATPHGGEWEWQAGWSEEGRSADSDVATAAAIAAGPEPTRVVRRLGLVLATAVAALILCVSAAGFGYFVAVGGQARSNLDDFSVPGVTAVVQKPAPLNPILIAGVGCKWAGVDQAIVDGAEIPAGPIQLVEGLAQIRFPGGAEVLVEGPASFDMAPGGGLFLWSGKLVAKTSTEELMINTTAAVVDVSGGIATECAILGEDSGLAEVHVLVGRVDVHPRKNNPEDRLVRRLQTGAAERYETFSRPGWKVIPLDSAPFARSLSSFTERKPSAYRATVLADKPLAYWRLSERSDGRVLDASGHGIDGDYQGLVALGQPAAIERDTDPSVFFQGGWALIDDSPELRFERDQPFSLESWVRSSVKDIDMRPIGKIGLPGAGSCPGYAMFIRNNVLTFQATHRWHSALHNRGVLDGDVLDVPGTTNVTDGRWHHLVISYDGSSKASGVKLFVDGRSEAVDRKHPYFCDTLTGTIRQSNVRHLELARGGSAFATNNFMGALDEVAVYDRALSSEQVARHYAAGRYALGSVDVVASEVGSKVDVKSGDRRPAK